MKELKLNLRGSWKRTLAMLTVVAMFFSVVSVSPAFAAVTAAENNVNLGAADSEDAETAEITVADATKPATVEAYGGTLNLEATMTVYDADFDTNKDSYTAVWSIEAGGEDFAEIGDSEKGVVTGKKAGNATVVLEVKNGSSEVLNTAELPITVTPWTIDGVTLEQNTDNETIVEIDGEDNAVTVSAGEAWAVPTATAKIKSSDAITNEGKANAAVNWFIDSSKPEGVLEKNVADEGQKTSFKALTPGEATVKVNVKTNKEDTSDEGTDSTNAIIVTVTTPEAVQNVEKMINDLPAADDLTLNDADAVSAAEAAYDALTPDQKGWFSPTAKAKLDAAMAKIAELAELKEAADVSAAEAVKNMIDALPAANDLTLADKAAVDAARTAYNGLTPDQKALVLEDTLAKLTAAEAKIEELEKAANDAAAAKKAADDAAKLINDLPAADKLTLADKAKVDAAKKAYDALSADAKALVPKTTVDKLNAAVAKIAELEKADANKKDDPAKDTGSTTVAPKVGEKKVVAGITYQVAKNNTVTYQKPKKNAKKVTIPATVKINGKTYKVTSIAKNAFKGNKKVKTVKVGKNVTTIGASAFQNCKALTTVTLPAKTTTIGKNAFAGSKKLKKIVIKSTKMTKKTIKNGAFKKVSKKVTVDVPNKKAKTYKKLFQKKGLPKACKVK